MFFHRSAVWAGVPGASMNLSNRLLLEVHRVYASHESIDEATAVLVTEMAKLQAKTVGGTEDFVVTREFKALADQDQRIVVLRACFAVMAANGTISAEETATINQIALELDIDDATLNAIRADYHEQLSSVQQIRRVTQGS